MASVQKLQYAVLPVMSCNSVSGPWQKENRRKQFVDCTLLIEICIDTLIVLFQLIHHSYTRLLFQKALVAYFSEHMFPLSHRPSQTTAHVTIRKFVKSFIFILFIAAARPLCGVKLRLIGVSDKHMKYVTLIVWRWRTNRSNLRNTGHSADVRKKIPCDIAWDRAQIWEVRGRRLDSLTNSSTFTSLLYTKSLKSKSSYLTTHVF
jgi:hypothetical protein